MKKIIIFLFLFGFFAMYAQTGTNNYTTGGEATTIATNFLRISNISPSRGYSVYSVPCGNHAALYEVVFQSGQSVIVAGHKTGSPILSVNYNTKGVSCLQYPEEFSAGFLYLLDRLYTVQVSSHEGILTDSMQQTWNNLLDSGANLSRGPQIGPILTTKWNQQYGIGCSECCSDYNMYMPQTSEICNGDTHYRYPTGCTVTAVGQVMNYWKFPLLRSDIPVQIDWCNMPDYIYCEENGSSSDIEREAVAKLMKLLGEELGTIYGREMTQTKSINVAWRSEPIRTNDGFGFLDPAVALPILQWKYGYSWDASWLYRWANESEWYDIIKNEITEGRPVIYWAFENSTPLCGHTFVCDGYDPVGDVFHFNWGHGNEGCWVTLSDLKEDENTHWNVLQCAIINFMPDQTEDFCSHSVWLSSFYRKFYQTHHSADYPPYTIVPSTMAYLYSADPTDRYIYRTIPDSATATYQAHEEVHLREGFTVERGADFTARIVPCPNCEENRVAGSPETASAPSNTTPPETATAHTQSTTDYQPPTTDLYPNPTSGEVTVGVDGEVQAIIIYTPMGLPVGGWRLLSIAPDRVTLDLSPLPAGTYILHIQTPMGVSTKRLVVAR